MIDLLILAMWLMMPAYIANPAAALLGGGRPIDMGKNFTDNKRILGDGKTVRGFILGSLCGAIVGAIQIWLARTSRRTSPDTSARTCSCASPTYR